MALRKKSLALGSTVTLAGGATGASLLALLMAASPASAVGPTYTVDTLDDGVANASDCTTPVVGSCSLRDALDAEAGDDTIVFATGLSGTILLTQGELELNNNITISGPGKDLLTIDANGASRIFYICSDSTIEGVTITGGSESHGGGLYDECGGTTTLRNVLVTGNTATSGVGGGVEVENLILIDSVIEGNTASESGGGVYASGYLTMSGSVISGNVAGVAKGGGGGAFVSGNITISDSTFDDNSARSCGGGLYAGVSGGTVTITDSTFSNNTATTSYGGAIDIDGNYNTVVIANTTITGNSATLGGGLHVDYGNEASLFMDTISGNSATSTDALYSGGGVHVYGDTTYPVTLTMVGTIVSGNTAAAGPADIGVGTSSTSGPNLATINDSLIGDVDSRLSITGSGNVISTAPGLGALADNGGHTKTMALLSTSAAVDAGPNPVPTAPGWVNIFDQRGAGFDRVVGTKSDIGAFEIQATPAPTTTTTVASDEPVAPAFTG